jgi:hypothetical protein
MILLQIVMDVVLDQVELTITTVRWLPITINIPMVNLLLLALV